MQTEKELVHAIQALDGATVHGGCPCCDALVVLTSGSPPGVSTRHDDGCPVLDGCQTAAARSHRATLDVVVALLEWVAEGGK